MPSIKILFFEIFLLNAKDDNILNFDAESNPCKSDDGSLSA